MVYFIIQWFLRGFLVNFEEITHKMVQRSYYWSAGNLFFCITLLLFLSGHLYADSPFLWIFPKPGNFLGGVRPLEMTPVEQLGDDGRWYEQLSAIWHWYLPLSIYITFF